MYNDYGGFFAMVLLGHGIGDYILQNSWMALSKNRKGLWGWFTCLVHCIIYTVVMSFCTGIYDPSFLSIVFFSHYIIDKFSLAEVWLKLIKGRSINEYLNDKTKIDKHMVLRGGFTTLVYAVVDNTFHIAIIFYAWIKLCEYY